MSSVHHDVLATAAQDALAAPSIFNTQPWRWRVHGDALELYADRDRQLTVADPQGRMLLLSCGAALHHARLSIAAAGWRAAVQPLVSAFDDALLARVALVERTAPSSEMLALHEAIGRRRTDRRPFGDEPVPAQAIARVVAAAEAEGVHLHRVRLDQLPILAIAAATAGMQEMADPAYRSELIRWSNRPQWSGDGIPAGTTVRPTPRRVPVRTLAVEPNQGMPVPSGGDRGSAYLVLHGEDETAPGWFAAGQALSAVLLTIVTLGLAAAPISDVIEVDRPRALVRGLLGGAGAPYVVIRCGVGQPATDLPSAPRRNPQDVIHNLPVR
jgi:hypothetical protein